jgi:hypothetical protein
MLDTHCSYLFLKFKKMAIIVSFRMKKNAIDRLGAADATDVAW